VPEPHDPRFQHWKIEERFGCTSLDKEVVLNPRTEMRIRKIARWAARWTSRPTLLALTKVRERTQRWRRS